MSALRPPAITSFMKGWVFCFPMQSWDIAFGEMLYFSRISLMSDSMTIRCDMSSWLRPVSSVRTSSKRCENGPCPTSCSSAASLSSCICSSPRSTLSAIDSAMSPATCIVPSTCSNLLWTPPG